MKAKTLLRCFGLLAAVSAAAFIGESLVASLFKTDPPAISKILPVTSIPLAAKQISEFTLKAPSAPEMAGSPPAGPHAPRKKATLYLKNGSEISGEIVSEGEDWITLNIDGSEAGFHRSEISRILRAED